MFVLHEIPDQRLHHIALPLQHATLLCQPPLKSYPPRAPASHLALPRHWNQLCDPRPRTRTQHMRLNYIHKVVP